MTRFVAVVAIVLIGAFAPTAMAERVGDRNVERCNDVQDLTERVRCEKIAGEIEPGPTASEQAPCEKARSGCANGRVNRATRPPFWIGHHYSGL